MAAAGTKGCEACHTTKAWPEVSAFDHSATTFTLTGAHRAVRCAECHRPPNLEMTLKNVNFSQAPQQCEDCHEDPHAAQFARANVTRCAECHNTTKWRPSLFDHEKTMFPLQGAHKNVPCMQCHKQIQLVEGKKVLFYKPTPKACAACHGTNIPPTPAKS
jgi:nitrate/TMAO reductase-like tetraheme cytochrome c subunit